MSENLVTIHTLAAHLGVQLSARGWSISVAESCTGGSLSAAITDIPGSSAWFDRGFITYSNASKESLLQVPNATLMSFGAVSEATALAMAEGARRASLAQISVAITGIAGPGGGSEDKPVGTVWIAVASPNKPTHAKVHVFPGNRQAIRHQAVFIALQYAIRHCERA